MKSNLKIDISAYETCIQLLKEKRFTEINDFDNHLDDLEIDWRNKKLENFINEFPSRFDTLSANN